MDYFIPSEIARLVLGYLKEEQCTKSYNLFVNECAHLREYAALLRHGREYPTTIADKNLKQILNDYGKHKEHEKRLKSHTLDGLWLKHDAVISQIRGRYTASTSAAAPSSGHTAARAQGQRFNRNLRPNAMGAIEQSRATVVTGDRLEPENHRHGQSLPSSPAPTDEALEDGTVDSDSEADMVEASKSLTPSRNRQGIRTMSPKGLGGILVDITQVEEHCPDLDYPASYPDGKRNNSVTQGEVVPSTSTEVGLSQENTFTNHQRKAASDSHSNVQMVKANSVVKPKQTKSSKPRKGKCKVGNGSQQEDGPVTAQEQCVQDQSPVQAPNAPDPLTEPALDCLTPAKSDPRTTAIAIGKSPRRKGPAPKRRSACRDDLSGVPLPITANSNSSNEEVLSMPLSMPCFDDLVNNLNLAEKLAQTINVVKQSAESATLNTAPAPIQTPSQSQLDPAPRPASPQKKPLRRSARRAKKDKQVVAAAATVSTQPLEVASEENIGNVLHLQDTNMMQEAVKSILEKTKSDPDFDILFHMFNSDKPIIFDEVEEPDVTQTALSETTNSVAEPVASTSTSYELGGDVTTTMTANYQASPQMATVLHPGMHGQPDYVETVKISAIQEVIRTPTTPQPPATQGEGCFKVPDPPVAGKSRETSPNVEESLASLKPKPTQGGSRKRRAKRLSIPRRKRSNSTDSNDSAGSEPGPAYVAPSPGLAHIISTPGPTEVTSSPGPTYNTPSPLLLTKQVNHIMSTATRMATSAPVANRVNQVSAEMVQNVISDTGELNMNQYAVVDLGHIQTPATISLVTSDGNETAVASTVMPNFNIMAELASYTPTSRTAPVDQEAASVQPEAADQQQLEQQPLVQQQEVPQEELVQQEQLEQQQFQQEPLMQHQQNQQEELPQQQQNHHEQLQQQQIEQQQQQVPQEQLPQQQQVPREKLPQQQQVPQEQLPQQQQVPREQLPQQQQVPREQLPQQQQVPREQLPQQQQVPREQLPQQQQQVPREQLPQQQQQVPQLQVSKEQLTEQQEAEQAACVLQSVYQLEPAVSSSMSLVYSSPQSKTLTCAAPLQQQHVATPTTSLQSTMNQPPTAVAAPSLDTKNNLQESSSKQLDTTPVSLTSTVPSPSSAQPHPQSENQPSVSSSQTSRSVSRCLYADEKTPTSKAGGEGKVPGVTPLVGSPFYSNPETPSLGAQEVVGSDSPAAASPALPKSAAHRLHINETPVSSKCRSGRSSGEPTSVTRRSRTKESCHSPGSARTRYTLQRVQSLSAAKRLASNTEQTVSVPPAESETKLESPTKENKTPEKVPLHGGGTPLATKEAEVAATMVAMATTPVKDRETPLYSYLPAGNAQAVLPADEQQTHTQTETQAQSDTESNTLNAPGTDRVYKTPKKQRLRAPNAVSPTRSPLLKSLIQVSAGALLNGHSGTSGSATRASPVKRQLDGEKGKDVRHKKSKRQKMAKMDVDKFLDRVHSPTAQRHAP